MGCSYWEHLVSRWPGWTKALGLRRVYHRGEVVLGELLPGSPIPLVKRREEISR